MNVLFLSLDGILDIEVKGLYSDFLRQFRDNGHDVYIVNSFEKRNEMPSIYYKKNGVHLLNVKIGNITKTSKIEKGISLLFIDVLFLRAVKKYLKSVEIDLIIYATPPITFDKVITYVKKKKNAYTYLLLKDIFPQNAVDLEMLNKNGVVYKYFRYKEKKLYQKSDFIGCMSEANVRYVAENNKDVQLKKLEICPNSFEPVQIRKDAVKRNEIMGRFNIPDNKTLFLYGGNLGKPHGIDFFIQCLKSNKLNEDVFFIIVGAGTEYGKMKSYFDLERQNNAILLNHLPKVDYEILANSCDVGLIFLDHRFTIPNFPSKILSYMQASIPVLAATDKNTDIGNVIQNGEMGFWCESSDVNEFNKKLKLLCNKGLRENLGKNGRRYMEKHYTARHTYDIIMKHFNS